MPVIFFCLIDGSCKFWTDDLRQTRKECEAVVMPMLVKLDKEDVIEFSEGACLPVKIRGA
jgi:hypothetical protein